MMEQIVAPIKPPPHSLEAEQSVLGALLLDNGAYDRVSFLREDDFYRDDHRRIFRAMQTLLERGRAADTLLTVEQLERAGDLDKCGGMSYLAGLVQNTPSALNVHRYAEVIRDRAILRQLCQHAGAVMERAMAGIEEPRTIAEDAEASFLSILDHGRADDFVHIGRACTEYVEWADAHPNGIETGFADLDALMGGLLPGSLIVVAGRPSMGKTALALQFSERICAKVPGLMFSLEASRREIAGRLIEWHKHRAGRDAAVDKVFNLKLFVDETAGISPGLMRARLRRMKRKHGVSLAVVDYLQLARGKGESREQEVSFISRELKAIAKEMQIPVVALSQLSRRVEERQDKRPSMADLRESGAIEQDADVILFPFRPDYYDKNFHGELAEAELIVAKNRQNGRTGAVKVSFSRGLNRFGDYMPQLFSAGAA